MSEFLFNDYRIVLTPEKRAVVLKLAQTDGQPWTEDQDESGWNDHMGQIMYGREADVVLDFLGLIADTADTSGGEGL
jgi:hypothetical protein